MWMSRALIGKGGSHDAASSVEAWAEHFVVDRAELARQFASIMQCKTEYLQTNPAARTQRACDFWPPLLQTQWRVLPDICHCIGTFIVLTFQNADVERDLGIIKKTAERAEGRLGMTRLDARVRIALHLPQPAKGRMEPVRGVIRTIARLWSSRQRRQAAPGAHSLRGAQGKVPLRGRRSGPTALEHPLQLRDASGLGAGSAEQPAEKELEVVDMAALLG